MFKLIIRCKIRCESDIMQQNSVNINHTGRGDYPRIKKLNQKRAKILWPYEKKFVILYKIPASYQRGRNLGRANALPDIFLRKQAVFPTELESGKFKRNDIEETRVLYAYTAF